MVNQENTDNQLDLALTPEQEQEVNLFQMALKRLIADEPMVASLKVWIIIASIAGIIGVFLTILNIFWK